MKYDYVIVGCGLFGSTFAYKAIQDKKTVLILDKRNHIGGNCYTEILNNIYIHIGYARGFGCYNCRSCF